MIEFLLGLPHLRRGPILDRARVSGSPVLLSANSFSRWRTAPGGWREWQGWDMRDLGNLAGMDAALDSAGFVMQAKYRGYEFTPQKYMELAAAYPWRWFASMDLCVEPEIAGDREAVRNRIAGTISLYGQCRRAAEAAGIADRLMPVIQGQQVADYLYCLDRYPVTAWPALVGIGSMCRRPVGGPCGLLAVVDALDRALGADPVRFHLFGIKSDGAEALRGHPRIASTDSQAYGTAARWSALHAGVSKTDAYVADVMGGWLDRQNARLARPGFAFQAGLDLAAPEPSAPVSLWARAEAEIMQELRDLTEAGELEANDLAGMAGLAEMIGERFQLLQDGSADEDEREAA